jgi:hypothetical protein
MEANHSSPNSSRNHVDPGTKGERFGKFPTWWITSGIWRDLKPSEAKILSVLVVLQHNQDHACWPDLDTLAELSGVARSSISEMTKSLAIAELITKQKDGNRIRYEIQVHSPEWRLKTGITLKLKSRLKLKGVKP